MRADFALDVRSQERQSEQEDSWELVFLVFMVCGRPSRLGERGWSRLLLEEGKLEVVAAGAAPGETQSGEYYGHKLGNFAVRFGRVWGPLVSLVKNGSLL